MNEADVDLAEGGSAEKSEPPAARRKYDDGDLPTTTRLPPVPRPPHLTGSRPPSQAPGLTPAPPSVEIALGTPEVRPPPHTSTSWWRSLLTSTVPPSAGMDAAIPDLRLGERRVALTCASLGIGLLPLGLLIGLWGGLPSGPPVVAAAALIARALVSLGVLAFGWSLLGMAERLFTHAHGR